MATYHKKNTARRVEEEASHGVASAARSSCEVGRRALATDPIGSILDRYSDALIPEARCRAARVCLEGSKSRNRLSEVPAWPVLFLPRDVSTGGWGFAQFTNGKPDGEPVHETWFS